MNALDTCTTVDIDGNGEKMVQHLICHTRSRENATNVVTSLQDSSSNIRRSTTGEHILRPLSNIEESFRLKPSAGVSYVDTRMNESLRVEVAKNISLRNVSSSLLDLSCCIQVKCPSSRTQAHRESLGSRTRGNAVLLIERGDYFSSSSTIRTTLHTRRKHLQSSTKM
jgi:hypothetical protein